MKKTNKIKVLRKGLPSVFAAALLCSAMTIPVIAGEQDPAEITAAQTDAAAVEVQDNTVAENLQDMSGISSIVQPRAPKDPEDEILIIPAKDEYDDFADMVLDAIITDSMTDYAKCCAIYDYIHAIPYIDTVYSDDWRENGYHMLKDRGGDCFGYYSASRLLLERLGYEVIEVMNNNGFTHVWCLVSIDQGASWQHFDPTCWRWGSDGYLCLVSDEELSEYAHRHAVGKNTYSHDWDRQQIAAEISAYESSADAQLYVLFPEEHTAVTSSSGN